MHIFPPADAQQFRRRTVQGTTRFLCAYGPTAGEAQAVSLAQVEQVVGRKVEYSAMRVVLEGEPTVWTTSTTTLALVNLENTQHRIGKLLAQCHASVSSLVNGSARIDSQDMALGALGMLEELTKHLGNTWETVGG